MKSTPNTSRKNLTQTNQAKRLRKSVKYSNDEQKKIYQVHKLLNTSRKTYASIGRKVSPHLEGGALPHNQQLRLVGKDVVRLCSRAYPGSGHLGTAPHTPFQSGGGKRPPVAHIQDRRMYLIHHLSHIG